MVNMGISQTPQKISKDEILAELVDLLRDMTSDWDLDFDDAIGPDTKLIADLEFESIDIVQLVVAIEKHFKRKGLPFEELLMADGRYVEEVVVSDTVTFLYRHLNHE
jgi:acyl carrier protein